jgi:hypothetical protein
MVIYFEIYIEWSTIPDQNIYVYRRYSSPRVMITHSKIIDKNVSHLRFWSAISDCQYILVCMADQNREWLTFWSAIITPGDE